VLISAAIGSGTFRVYNFQIMSFLEKAIKELLATRAPSGEFAPLRFSIDRQIQVRFGEEFGIKLHRVVEWVILV
jgi:hypothetical protein